MEKVSKMKTRIYNLIILDKSGSMSCIRNAAYQGCNEVIDGIQAAAEKYKDKQEQFISLLLFDSESMPYIHNCISAKDARKLTENDYVPLACTPLLDAMGMSLLELEKEVDKYDDAVGMVTVITDGEENSSHKFTYYQIQQLVGRLKEKGWNFAFMGANQDVKKICIDLNINIGNAREFSCDDEGMRDTWRRDREAKDRYYERMCKVSENTIYCSSGERRRAYTSMNDSSAYFEKTDNNTRITPDYISNLSDNEIFVFGSNARGMHAGGAAAFAMSKFGAIWGQGEGMQGQSYAIPTMGTFEETKESVHRFIEFAKKHADLKFFVTAIGCGIAGYTPSQIAPLFSDAAKLDNVYLPQPFWNEINK